MSRLRILFASFYCQRVKFDEILRIFSLIRSVADFNELVNIRYPFFYSNLLLCYEGIVAFDQTVLDPFLQYLYIIFINIYNMTDYVIVFLDL